MTLELNAKLMDAISMIPVISEQILLAGIIGDVLFVIGGLVALTACLVCLVLGRLGRFSVDATTAAYVTVAMLSPVAGIAILAAGYNIWRALACPDAYVLQVLLR